MKSARKITALCLTLLLVLSLAGCGRDDTMTLRIGLLGQSVVPECAMVRTDSEKIVVSHLYDNLMRLALDGEGGTKVVSEQAANFHCEDELDGTQTYTFTLRSGLTWSDGQPVTAGDYVYAWQHLADPATASPNAYLMSVVAGYDQVRSTGDASLLQVSAEDDKTLTVKLNCHCPYFLSDVCTAAATMPARADGVFATNGAYGVASQENGYLVLTTSADYYDAKRIGPDQLQFIFRQTSAELEKLYNDNELDFMLPLPGEGAAEENAPVYPAVSALLVNQSAPGMKETAVRQALSLVIDRNELVSRLSGAFLPTDGLVSADIRAEDGSVFRDNNGALIDNDPAHYQDNCTAARELLTQAGVDASALGTVTLLYAENERSDTVAAYLSQVWKDSLGIEVIPLPVAEDKLGEALSRSEFTLALTDVTGAYNDATAFLSQFRSTADGNYGRYHSSAYDMLLRVAAVSSSEEARMAYLEDAERLLLENGGVIPLYGMCGNYLMRDKLTGLVSNGVGIYYFGGVQEVTE